MRVSTTIALPPISLPTSGYVLPPQHLYERLWESLVEWMSSWHMPWLKRMSCFARARLCRSCCESKGCLQHIPTYIGTWTWAIPKRMGVRLLYCGKRLIAPSPCVRKKDYANLTILSASRDLELHTPLSPKFECGAAGDLRQYCQIPRWGQPGGVSPKGRPPLIGPGLHAL